MINLVIDIGNTLSKFALFNKNTLIYSGNINNEDSDNEIADILNNYKEVRNAIISSVRENPPFVNFVKEKLTTIELSHTTPLPIKINYKSPETLGRDRIAGAVAASILYGNPALSIDAGTCITYDFVNENGEYEGGAISPGIDMRLKAMNYFTEKLPYINFKNVKDSVPLIGQDTQTCLLAGAINGSIYEIEQTITYYKEQYPSINVVLCGGDATFLAKAIKNSIFADPFLVLKGLNIILQFNVPDK
jgi:type III pantothenate kinase